MCIIEGSVYVMKRVILILLLILSVFISTNVYALTNVSIENVTVVSKSDTIEVEDPVLSGNTISSKIGFKKIDDYVNFDIEIKNQDSKNISIKNIIDNLENDNIEITYDYDQQEFGENEKKTVRVSLKYKKQLYNIDELDLSNLKITIQFNGADDLNINPLTGDSIYTYILMLILSICGFVFLLLKNKKLFKAGSVMLVLAALLLPVMIFANNENKLEIILGNCTVAGEWQYFDVQVTNNNGTADSELHLKYGTLVGSIEKPSKNGYTFAGWYNDNNVVVPDSTSITEEMHLTAHFTAVVYHITYTLAGGDAENPTTYTIESNITLNNPTRLGYQFVGWTGSNGNTPSQSVTIHGLTGDLNYTAVWEEIHGSMVNLRSINNTPGPLASIEEHVKTITFVTLTPAQVTAKNEAAASNSDIVVIDLTDGTSGASVYAWAVPNTNDATLYDVTIGSTALKISFPEDSSWMFNAFRAHLTKVDFGTSVDTSITSNFSAMFNACGELTQIVGLKDLNTSSLRYMDWMFQNCSKLTSIDMSNYDTSRVTTMWGLFSGCTALTNIDLTGFNTSNVTVMNQMFLGCSHLETLNLSSFTTTKVEDFRFMFQNNTSLVTLNFDNLTFNNMTGRDMAMNIFQNMPISATVKVASCDTVQWIEDNLSKDVDYPIRWTDDNFTTKNGNSCDVIRNTAYLYNNQSAERDAKTYVQAL